MDITDSIYELYCEHCDLNQVEFSAIDSANIYTFEYFTSRSPVSDSKQDEHCQEEHGNSTNKEIKDITDMPFHFSREN